MAVSDYSSFDVQAAQERQMIDDAQLAGQLPLGGGMMFASSGMGDIYNQGMMGLSEMMGGAPSPEVAKQQAILEIQERFPNPDTFEEFMELANALRMGGFYSFAEQAMDAANDLRSSLPDETEDTLTTKESTMEMAAQFHQCAIDAGGWKNADQECKTAVKKTFVEMQRQTADEAGMIEASKAEAEAIQDTQTTIYLQSDAAADSIASIEQSIDLLPGIYSGTVGEGIKGFKTLLVSLGIIDESRNVEEEMFLRNSMKSVTDWIQKTKGSISDKEMDAFIAASPGLRNTRAGNLMILETMLAAADYYTRLETEYNDWKTKANARSRASGIPVSEVEWRNHKAHWYRTGGKPKMPTAAQIKVALLPDSDEVVVNAYEVTVD